MDAFLPYVYNLHPNCPFHELAMIQLCFLCSFYFLVIMPGVVALGIGVAAGGANVKVYHGVKAERVTELIPLPCWL